MQLREALRTQGPSYALQEAARDEIARLDGRVKHLEEALAQIAAQSSGIVGSTAKADCLAAWAKAALF